jgi:ribosome maturation protein SDO1
MNETIHLAKLKKEQNTFEVVIDSDLAMEFREKKNVALSEVLKCDKIFFDAKKGQEASHERLEALFETDNFEKIAEEIVLKGEIQLSSEYREKKRKEVTTQLIQMINRYGVDPKNNLPHPVTRIENALEEAKVRIDENKPAKEQLKDVIAKLRTVLPIKLVLKEIEVRIPGIHATKMYGVLTQFGKILNESWENDGSWFGIIEIPGGLEVDFYDKINSITHGGATTKVVKTK